MKELWICILLIVAGTTADTYDDNLKDDYDLYDGDLWSQEMDAGAYDMHDDYQIEDNRSGVHDDTEQKADKDDSVVNNQALELTSDEQNNVLDEVGANEEDKLKQAESYASEEADEDINTYDKIVLDASAELASVELNDSENASEEKKDLDNSANLFAKEVARLLAAADLQEEDEFDSKENNKDRDAVDKIIKDIVNLEPENRADDIVDEENERDIPNDENDDSKNNNDNSEVQKVIEETQAILEEDEGNDFANDKVDEVLVPADIIEDAKQILREIDNEDVEANPAADNTNEEDTLDKVYDDLNADLKQLQETLKKLSSDYVEREDNADDSINPKETFDFSGEKRVLEARLGADDVNEDDMINDSLGELDDDDSDEVDQVVDKNNESDDKVLEAVKDSEVLSESDEEIVDEADDDEFSNGDDTIDKEPEVIKENLNADDNVDIFAPVEENKSVESSRKSEQVSEKLIETSPSTPIVDDEVVEAVKKMNVTDLAPAEYDQLMSIFRVVHAEEFNNDMDRNVAPVHIELSVDKATVVTSPNYPSPYPTNNVVDWVFTGDGVGIELNITDFFINGVLGDYLLFIPGGLDATNTDGLLFSYRLNEPRRYRFFDVDQMFVRFEAQPGMAFTRGFSFSVKMISERIDLVEEPDTEPVAPEPTESHTVYIGGLTLPEFRNNLEPFREIVAGMAVMYINSIGVDPGLVPIINTTQIIRTAPCNVRWPGYELCAEVAFGVSMLKSVDGAEVEEQLTQGQLNTMWSTYSTVDPSAAMLRALGMSEFEDPDDSAMVMWVVLGVGVVVCVVMLTFALWRFSCFENYTRMPQYSDRDSVYSAKQGLDLYPTPHQTLPPLFAESDYKWVDAKYEDSARVDMGGFTNKSYARDMYDIDSDEEDIVPRERMAGDTPKDKFEV